MYLPTNLTIKINEIKVNISYCGSKLVVNITIYPYISKDTIDFSNGSKYYSNQCTIIHNGIYYGLKPISFGGAHI